MLIKLVKGKKNQNYQDEILYKGCSIESDLRCVSIICVRSEMRQVHKQEQHYLKSAHTKCVSKKSPIMFRLVSHSEDI